MIKVIKHEGQMIAITMKDQANGALLVDFLRVDKRHSDTAYDEVVRWKSSYNLYRAVWAEVLIHCEKRGIEFISTVTSDSRRARVYAWLAKKTRCVHRAVVCCTPAIDTVTLELKSERVCWLR